MVDIFYQSLPQGHICLGNGSSVQEAVRLEYLAEGNANVVYAFKPLEKEHELPTALKHKLLRLRKDKSFIQPARTQFATYQRHFAPLFHADNLVEHILIPVDQGVFSSLNKGLEYMELSGLRPKQRHGDILAVTEDYGLLITDMTAQPGEYLFEIKPKWLQQSPDAPSNSIHCRTCALRMQRSAAKAKGAIVPKPGGFCPLSLVDADVKQREKAFESIVRSQAKNIPEHSVRSIVRFLAEEGYRVLEDLRKYQERFDNTGLVNSSMYVFAVHLLDHLLIRNSQTISEEYLKAMTLRDCLLFIKGSPNSFPDTAEVRLADLDFKQAHPDKVEKWKSTEKMLIHGGWYTNSGAQSTLEPLCLLSQRSCGST